MIEVFAKKEKLPEFYTITEKEESDRMEEGFNFQVVDSSGALVGEVKSTEDGKILIETILKKKGLDVSVVETNGRFYPKDKSVVRV